MATKRTCYCVGDLEERREELACAIEIAKELETYKDYWMQEDEKTKAFIPIPGFETKVRIYNETIKWIIENYG